MANVIALVLVVYGAYALYAAFSGQGYTMIIGAVLALIAASGLFLRKSWSQYFVYVISTTVVAEWLWLVWRSTQQSLWPSGGTLQSIIALVPGLFLVAFAIGSSVLVFRNFRRSKLPPTSTGSKSNHGVLQ